MATPLEKYREDVGAKNRFPADMDAIRQRVVYLARLEKRKSPATRTLSIVFMWEMFIPAENW